MKGILKIFAVSVLFGAAAVIGYGDTGSSPVKSNVCPMASNVQCPLKDGKCPMASNVQCPLKDGKCPMALNAQCPAKEGKCPMALDANRAAASGSDKKVCAKSQKAVKKNKGFKNKRTD